MPQTILQQVQTIRSLYEKMNRQHGQQFNVFTITGIGERETLMCRMLHDLLNPSGSHGQGRLYLQLFVEEVLRVPFTDDDYERTKVAYEFTISESRRIDIVIQTPNYFIPIEVKIYAGDQKNQCNDYFEWAKNSNVYYVTIEGREPSAYSLGNMSIEDVTCISFDKDIVNWLEHCMTTVETVHLTSIREILRQMIEAIRQFSGEVGDEEMDETLQIIMRDKESMKNAKLILEAFEKSRGEMIRKVFERLKQDIAYEYIADEDDYRANNFAAIRNYRSKPYPIMWFLVKKHWYETYDLYMYIEVNWRLYVGFALYDDENNSPDNTQLLDVLSLRNGEYGNVWDYLPTSSDSPLFSKPDLQNNFFDLFDDLYFEQFIEKCLVRINELIKRL